MLFLAVWFVLAIVVLVRVAKVARTQPRSHPCVQSHEFTNARREEIGIARLAVWGFVTVAAACLLGGFAGQANLLAITNFVVIAVSAYIIVRLVRVKGQAKRLGIKWGTQMPADQGNLQEAGHAIIRALPLMWVLLLLSASALLALPVVNLVVRAQQAAAGANSGSWTVYVSTEGRYSVTAPGQPTMAAETLYTPDHTAVHHTHSFVVSDDFLAQVTFIDRTSEVTSRSTARSLLHQIRSDMEKATGSKPHDLGRTELQGYPAVEYEIYSREAKVHLRVLAVIAGNRAYQAIAVTSAGPEASIPTKELLRQRFTNSFRILEEGRSATAKQDAAFAHGEWSLYWSAPGQFAIELPGIPDVGQDGGISTSLGELDFAVTVTNLLEGTVVQENQQLWLRLTAEGMLSEFGAQPLDAADVAPHKGLPARRTRFYSDYEGLHGEALMVLAGRRHFGLVALSGVPLSDRHKTTIERLFGSFSATAVQPGEALRITGGEGRLARETAESLAAMLALADRSVRWTAVEELARRGPAASAAVPMLTHMLEHSRDLYVRWYSAWLLGRMGPDARSAVRVLTGALKDEQESVRVAAREALDRLERN